MIWIDSSFAVEWLQGLERAKGAELGDELLAILPSQYLEVYSFFLKMGRSPVAIAHELEPLELKNPEKVHLQHAASLYLEARRKKSKASLADALLAAVARVNAEKIAAFDGDFAFLGLKKQGVFWHANSS